MSLSLFCLCCCCVYVVKYLCLMKVYVVLIQRTGSIVEVEFGNYHNCKYQCLKKFILIALCSFDGINRLNSIITFSRALHYQFQLPFIE